MKCNIFLYTLMTTILSTTSAVVCMNEKSIGVSSTISIHTLFVEQGKPIADVASYDEATKHISLNLQSLGLVSLKGLADLVQDVQKMYPVGSLFVVDLSGNKIRKLRVNDLRVLGGVRELNLSHNKIVDIQLGTFKRLRRLKILDLSYNNLKKLDARLFEQQHSLQKLRLHKNRSLVHVPHAIFMPLTKLKKLYVDTHLKLDRGSFSSTRVKIKHSD